MLESHHALVVKALQQLYTHCINNKCFPGEPIDTADGYPLIHSILDRLGLIKEAEENPTDIFEEVAIEASQYWRFNRRSLSSFDAEESSSAQASPVEESPVSDTSSGLPTAKPNGSGRQPFTNLPGVYSQHGPFYYMAGQGWPISGNSTSSQAINFGQPIAAAFQGNNNYAHTHSNESPNVTYHENGSYNSTAERPPIIAPGPCPPAYQGSYPEDPIFPYPLPSQRLTETDQRFSWTPNPWNRLKVEHPNMELS